jgi:hypothetical protein
VMAPTPTARRSGGAGPPRLWSPGSSVTWPPTPPSARWPTPTTRSSARGGEHGDHLQVRPIWNALYAADAPRGHRAPSEPPRAGADDGHDGAFGRNLPPCGKRDEEAGVLASESPERLEELRGAFLRTLSD